MCASMLRQIGLCFQNREKRWKRQLKATLVTDTKLFRDALVECRNNLAVTHHCDRWIDCQTVVAWASFGQFTFIITLVSENWHILENYIPVHVMPDEALQGFAIFLKAHSICISQCKVKLYKCVDSNKDERSINLYKEHSREVKCCSLKLGNL